MQLKTLIAFLETIAPPRYQESYDNAQLITGHPEMDIDGVLICLDSTEAVLEEAGGRGLALSALVSLVANGRCNRLRQLTSTEVHQPARVVVEIAIEGLDTTIGHQQELVGGAFQQMTIVGHHQHRPGKKDGFGVGEIDQKSTEEGARAGATSGDSVEQCQAIAIDTFETLLGGPYGDGIGFECFDDGESMTARGYGGIEPWIGVVPAVNVDVRIVMVKELE